MANPFIQAMGGAITRFPPVNVTAWEITSLSQSLQTGLQLIDLPPKCQGRQTVAHRPEIITRYSGENAYAHESQFYAGIGC